jgi:hypothetical protein
MRHPHKWEEMLPEEFFEEFERSPIAYWACGASVYGRNFMRK